MSMRHRPKTRIPAAIAIVLIGASALMSACGGSSAPAVNAAQTTTGETTPATAAEITLTGLDVEMHYAEG